MNSTNLVRSAVLAGLSLLEPSGTFHPEPVGKIEDERVEESSGLAHSRQLPGLWWTHNDSGHSNHIYPMSADGTRRGERVRVEGAVNIDWESIAADEEGQLWISDLGNNANRRRDLAVYVIDEPLPDVTKEGEIFPEEAAVKRKIRVRYPDQEGFPPENLNFDSEAIFVREGVLYAMTKHRSDASTTLYMLRDDGGDEEQVFTRVQGFAGIGMVTGAALHPDGKRLAMLTYTGVWLFESDGNTDRFLDGRVSNLPISVTAWRQVEGIDWLDEHTLLISNEQRDLFRIRVEQLRAK